MQILWTQIVEAQKQQDMLSEGRGRKQADRSEDPVDSADSVKTTIQSSHTTHRRGGKEKEKKNVLDKGQRGIGTVIKRVLFTRK